MHRLDLDANSLEPCFISCSQQNVGLHRPGNGRGALSLVLPQYQPALDACLQKGVPGAGQQAAARQGAPQGQ